MRTITANILTYHESFNQISGSLPVSAPVDVFVKIYSLFPSESSLFVAKDHIVLKTCGRTKLLACVKPLLELTRKYLKINRAVVSPCFLISYFKF